MLTLYQMPTWPDHPNPSPFCLKVETYLRMTKIPYQATIGDVRKAPKGKLPYVDDDGTVIPDSGFILAHLERKHGAPLDGGISDADRARGHLIRRTFEESLYFPMVYSRFADEANFAEVKKLFEGMIPALLRGVISRAIRKKTLEMLKLQGTARHSREQVFELGKQDLEALSITLGSQPFFLGDRPRTVDATAYGFLVNVLYQGTPSPLGDYARSLENLVTYVERMKQAYWPDAAPKSRAA